jgi:hypothetical protein
MLRFVMGQNVFQCDGCGQPGSPEHFARRLKRLEQATRFRPIHIQTLFLGAAPQVVESEFLYDAGEPTPQGEAAAVLANVGISQDGRAKATVLSEFQRGGFFLTHILECPFEESLEPRHRNELLGKRIPAALVRLTRSLRPKRVTLITEELAPFAKMLKGGMMDVEFGALAQGRGSGLNQSTA